ncbi:UDP-galactopyranose mutase [Paracoccus sp. (in: a-proteobacteria)]|uniref:UDP-galactopyranose mutase n=1 Tax=Paracoccus sp. TaxID=267 RepID=UPI00396CFF2C
MTQNLPLPMPAASRLLCFSHLRWNFVFQRPQHLLTRAAATADVLYVEEPVHEPVPAPIYRSHRDPSGVTILTPVLPEGHPDPVAAQRALLDEWLSRQPPLPLVTWYYTPMALGFSRHLVPDLCIYDCMDELSAFLGAPPELTEAEDELFARADLVFAGGRALYEAKAPRHPAVHLFPSSVDRQHFAAARDPRPDPVDQAPIPLPRIGFFGVIDERMDTDLVGRMAQAMPEVQFVMLGPVVKIDPAQLPQAPNLHWLGGKGYADLPDYLSNWTAGWMPFALNASTRFISPTKTPEFLAAGLRLVSTAVPDVVRGYGDNGIVAIADGETMVAALQEAMLPPGAEWLQKVEAHLQTTSWDGTWAEMAALMAQARRQHATPVQSRKPTARSYDWLVVGAGFAGSVLAERLAAERGERVLVIDRRPHVAGNAYDHLDDAGILIHQYGPHIFHTNAPAVADYLSQFTEWRDYEHRVLAQVDGQLLPIPINLDTVNRLYGLDLDSEGMEAFLAERREPVDRVQTSEDVVVSTVGRDLYEKFFRGYTRKQWGMDPSELASAVTARIPTRTNRDDRYFGDSFQKMPAEGYTRMFQRMLDHPNIDIQLDTDFRDLRGITYKRMIFTGPIDEYFDHRLGKLPYRSLTFRHVTRPVEWAQPVAVVNFPQTEDYTRVTEYKHLTGQQNPQTSLTYEYPSDVGDPYYPVPRPENEALYKQYQALADKVKDVWFVGRLATYRYYNMDQVVGQALATFKRIDAQLGRAPQMRAVLREAAHAPQ